MSRNTISATVGISIFVASSLAAQVTDAAQSQPRQPAPREVLDKAIRTMTKLTAVTFRTTEAQDSSMGRRMAKQLGGAMGLGGGNDIDVRGSLTDGILRASLNDDEDQILSYRGRMIARNDDVEWKPRRGRLVTGGALPFVLDPSRLFEALESLPKSALAIKHSKSSTYKDEPVLILGITLTGDAAQDFALGGSLPPVSSGMGGMGIMRMMRGGGGGGGAELPDLTIDIALYVEPATGYVHKVKTRSYQKSNMRGGIQIAVRGGGGGGFGGDDDDDEEEEEDEVKEKDDQGKRIYKRGVPVRKLEDDLSKMEYDVILTKHGHPTPLELDENARRLLRLGIK